MVDFGFHRVWGGWDYRDGPGAGICGWATALAHAFGWVSSSRWGGIALLGWGLASLPSLPRWCGIALLGLGVGISPLLALVGMGLRSWGWVVGPLLGLGSGLATVYINKLSA